MDSGGGCSRSSSWSRSSSSRPWPCSSPSEEAARRACRSPPGRRAERFTRSRETSSWTRRSSSECNGSYSCLEQAFGNIAFERGPKRALAVFETELVRNRDVERDCHRIVHTIGSATYARYDGDVARTFAEGSSTCASGYYHGILERAFVGITSKAQLGEAARELCLDVGIRRRSFLDYQCRHGLGHGFMIQTGYDLPTALSLCSGLGSGWDRVTCTSGSFMENVSTRFGYEREYRGKSRAHDGR